jgi:hypothetical protein
MSGMVTIYLKAAEHAVVTRDFKTACSMLRLAMSEANRKRDIRISKILTALNYCRRAHDVQG